MDLSSSELRIQPFGGLLGGMSLGEDMVFDSAFVSGLPLSQSSSYSQTVMSLSKRLFTAHLCVVPLGFLQGGHVIDSCHGF